MLKATTLLKHNTTQQHKLTQSPSRFSAHTWWMKLGQLGYWDITAFFWRSLLAYHLWGLLDDQEYIPLSPGRNHPWDVGTYRPTVKRSWLALCVLVSVWNFKGRRVAVRPYSEVCGYWGHRGTRGRHAGFTSVADLQHSAQIGSHRRWLASSIPCRWWEQRASPLSHEYRLENFAPRAAV